MTEDEQIIAYLKKVALVIVIALLVVLATTYALYTHPLPAKDCSKPYIYPICERAITPEAAVPPTTGMLVFTFIIMALIAIVLVKTSYKASVIEQKEIITAVANVAAAKGVAPPSAKPTKGVDPKLLK